MAKDYDLIPKDYEELYQHYFKRSSNGSSIVRTLIRKLMPKVTEDEHEVLSQDIFTRCIDKRLLAIYDPTKANFGGAVYFVARSICVNYMERKMRDPLGVLNAGSLVETQEDEVIRPGEYSMSRLETDQVGTERRYEAQEIVLRLWEWSLGMLRNAKNVRDQKMHELVKLLLEENTPKECAEKLGVSQTTVSNWTKLMEAEVRKWS